ncbi:ribonuclease HII [Dictyobacter vulcani]|uniref:Ribonuclease HII n=1 Tax=Dictyobacter vulcani TaxID=2607529 RepID=A0A5J4KPS8_9CHLR|nr:ribonuclease HII [Dictyobacter vulcani]GER88447.1 ribonuclease HII [Dictyobacter vulcani]
MQTHKKYTPTLAEEMALFEQGYSFIAGLDEAGRGCLAGPVVAGAVILPRSEDTLELFAGVNDSKQLSAAARERYYEHIMQHALAVGVGIGSVEVIDTRNILQATKYAMQLALEQLSPRPDALLLDALYLPKVNLPQRSIIKGDSRSLSIAAASIIAKVTRDRLMVELHQEHPAYGFEKHKGYGTPAHLAALRAHGATPHHRRSFSPVSELYGLFANTDD